MLTPATRIVRRYRVLDALGEGGLGTAFRVWDEATEEERALKLVPADAIHLLRSEFALLVGLFHPHVLSVYDFGATSSREGMGGYYTAELLRGRTLEAFAEQSDAGGVRAALADALSGLAFLHQLGIRHGDFKSDNIIVDEKGRATLIDLSCASRFDQPLELISGTPGYIAPELSVGRVVDGRADLYAVGATLKQLFAATGDPLLATRWVDRMLTARPEDRPAEVWDVLAALGEDRTSARIASGRSPNLLERDAPLLAFERILDAVCADQPGPRAIAMWGDAGMGKSRLMGECKWRAQLRCAVTEHVLGTSGQARPDALRLLLRRAGANIEPSSQAATLETVLRATAELGLSPAPTVLCVDDADRLTPSDQSLLEAMLRSLPEDGRLVVLVSAARPFASDGAAVQHHHLGPLSRTAIGDWAGPLVNARYIEALTLHTGGHPAYVESCLRQIAEGTRSEADLAAASPGRLAASVPTSELVNLHRVHSAVESLDVEARNALAAVVAWDGLLPSAVVGERMAALVRLATQGWVRPEPDGVRLVRLADVQPLAQALGDAMLPAYEEASRGATDWATRLNGLVQIGDVSAAERMFVTRSSPPSRERGSGALDGLARKSRDPEILMAIADQQLALGRAPRCLTAVARLLRSGPSHDARHHVWLRAGKAYLQMEKPARAARYLRRALDVADKGGQTEIAAHLVRANVQFGAYADAAGLATHYLAEAPADDDSPSQTELSRGLGMAATFLGQPEVASHHLQRAIDHTSEAQQPRDLSRTFSYLAILSFRSGELGAAAAAYRRALDLAERYELSDMLPTLILNVGTACQQLGEWGEALVHYERGHRVATALGKSHARAILELNLTNLLAEVGLSERATAMLERADRTIASAQVVHLAGHRDTIAAEIAVARGDMGEASVLFAKAKTVHLERGEKREAAEAILHSATVTLWTDPIPPDELEAALEAVADLLEDQDANDVQARLMLVRADLARARGDLARAHEWGQKGERLAVATAQPLLIAAAYAALGTIRQESEDSAEATLLMSRASSIWQDVAASLPEPMRDAFWRHPRRRAAARPNATSTSTSTADAGESPRIRRPGAEGERLRRVLALSARVSSSLSLDRVLELAMDAAIELTGAERGFLLLRSAPGDTEQKSATAPAAVKVAVARNLDQRQLGRGDLAFSSNIAEQVLRSGEPVVTFDASGDARFRSHRSVHAMQLKSVVCVPVSAHGESLGALYLDNRFELGRFATDDIGVVLAFANQLALSIQNAQLHAALEDKSTRLLVEKRRVERLSKGQAVHIERLEQRVRSQQEVLEHRYDYSAIVHKSAPMKEVLDLLDRVIDTDLTILIEGESGTGKELVARAVHFNGPRREGPMVNVNCGALSETLLESELFGHVRGAFTGADRDRDGLMVAAAGGTLFLDEIGELSLAMQVKLLRALQEREVRPVGSAHAVTLDVRVLGATNRRLKDEVEAGRFREDLYYRLGVVEVRLPPLRERDADIIPIARAIVERQAAEAKAPPPELSREAVRALLRYQWPGNVRQLENTLTRAYVLSDRRVIKPADLDLSAKPTKRAQPRSRAEFERLEIERIHQTLIDNRWNVSQTARALGMPRNTLYRKMESLGIQRG